MKPKHRLLLPLLGLSVLPAMLGAVELLPGPGTSCAPLTQDDDDQKPDGRPEVKQLLNDLLKHAKKRGDEDEQAIALLDQALQEFEASGPKDRKAIVKMLERLFKERRREREDGTPENGLHLAAATALRAMGPESVKPLIGLVGNKNFRDDILLQRRLILSLGATRDEAGVKTLSGMLNHHQAGIQAAACEALGEHEEAPLKLRKSIFEDLLKTLMRQQAEVDTDPEDVEARERYDVIAGPIITSLQRLSGHDERNPHEWQRWWNKNKRADWDESG